MNPKFSFFNIVFGILISQRADDTNLKKHHLSSQDPNWLNFIQIISKFEAKTENGILEHKGKDSVTHQCF